MAITQILDTILSIYKKCGISEFPVDLSKLYNRMGWRHITYVQAESLGHYVGGIFDVETPAKTVQAGGRYIIYYSSIGTPEDIRMALTHEAAHILLGKDSTEASVRSFVTEFLVPLAPMFFVEASTSDDIMRICSVPRNVAISRADDLTVFGERVLQSGYTKRDRLFLRQFGMK